MRTFSSGMLFSFSTCTHNTVSLQIFSSGLRTFIWCVECLDQTMAKQQESTK